MKKIILSVCAALAALSLSAGELKWHTSLPDALKLAKKENKMVLVDFTGSDWCGWCIKLKKEIFDTKEFTEYAEKNLVLVEVDFPRTKKQSAEVQKANQELQAKYKVQGYPTLVGLNGDGKEIWRGGYVRGGPSVLIGQISAAKTK
jgi:thioredoxin-related protein